MNAFLMLDRMIGQRAVRGWSLGGALICLACMLPAPAYSQSLSVPALWTRSAGGDWPRMLGPDGNGHSPEKGILQGWDQGRLAIRWSQRTGTGYGNAVVAKGRAVQWDRFDQQERLTCYHAESGEELWRWESPVRYQDLYGYNNGPRSSPVIDEDRVYAYGVAGTLACVALATGEELWKIDLNERYGVVQNFFGVGSTPCVFEDKLLVMVGGSPAESQQVPEGRLNLVKANGSAFVAFDKRSGAELYRVGQYLASYSAPVIATIDGRPWCLSLVREGLLLFDPRDGSGEVFFPWRASFLESVNAAWPVVVGNRIFISECYEKGSAWLEFDGRKLQVRWSDPQPQRNQAMRAHWATPVLDGDFLYGCSGRNEPDADFRCIRLTDGAVQWTHRNRDRTTCLAVDGHLVVLGEHGLLQLVRLNPEKFELVTEVDLGSMLAPDDAPWLDSPTWAPPVLSHGLLYLRGQRRLVCLELIPE
jgi:outer membrane protein assembly factor BamB